MEIFQELNNEGITVLIVTHERDIAEHAKRVVHVRDGIVEREELVSVRRDAREILNRLTSTQPPVPVSGP